MPSTPSLPARFRARSERWSKLREAVVRWTAPLLLGAAGACSQSGADSAPEVLADGYPRSVESPWGVTLELRRPPLRVMPANASALDYLATLLPPERMVAIPELALTWSNAALEGPRWDAVERVARYEGETVLAIAPDLVVAHESQSADTARVLRDAGIAVAALPPFRDFDSVRESIAFLGDLLEVRAEADALLMDLEARITALQGSEKRRGLRAISYTNYGTGGWIAGARTSADSVIRLAGLRNAAAEAGLTEHPRIDIEGLLELDPDIVMLGAAEQGDGPSPTLRYMRSEPALANLRALREGRIVVLPAALFGTDSHFLVDAAERLAREIDGLEATTGGSER